MCEDNVATTYCNKNTMIMCSTVCVASHSMTFFEYTEDRSVEAIKMSFKGLLDGDGCIDLTDNDKDFLKD